MISGVGGQKPAVQGANESISIQNKIEKLEQQKKVLKKEMERIKKDDTIDKKTAASKVKDLEKKINTIDLKIKQLKQKQNPKTDETGNASPIWKAQKEDKPNKTSEKEGLEIPKDIFEKKDATEQWDNTYSLVQEEGETRIKYLRPKKGDD